MINIDVDKLAAEFARVRMTAASGTANGRCAGFTLLEVLMASVLSATLLLTLWSLIGTYTSLFSTGGAKTEQSQIARSLLQQMSDDLRGAIQDTAARQRLQSTLKQSDDDDNGGGLPADSSTESPDAANVDSSAVRRFGLFGTQHELRIDVLQIVPLEVSLAAYRADEDRGQDSLSPDEPRRRAPELRTVCYTFNKRREVNDIESLDSISTADEAGMETETDLLGLIREEIDFETRDPSARGERLAGRLTNRSTRDVTAEENVLDEFAAATGETSDEEIDARIDSGAVLWVPEVAGLEFRYFDGSGWTSQWDSIQRKSLPVAVEIRLEIESLDPRAVRRRAEAEAAGEPLGGEVESVGGTAEEDAISTEEIRREPEEDASRKSDAESELPEYKTYRLVVELPSANLHKGPNKSAAQTDAALDRPQPLWTQRLEPSTLPAPPSSSKPPADKKASEQWLRTNAQ